MHSSLLEVEVQKRPYLLSKQIMNCLKILKVLASQSGYVFQSDYLGLIPE